MDHENTKSMDIYAPRGAKVVFAFPQAGYRPHQDLAKSHLKKGEEYTVNLTVVGNSHTDVYLQEFPGIAFNSVLFADVSHQNKQAPSAETGEAQKKTSNSLNDRSDDMSSNISTQSHQSPAHAALNNAPGATPSTVPDDVIAEQHAKIHQRNAGDRLIDDIANIAVASAKVAMMPKTCCGYIVSELLERMHDLFETQCTAIYTASGAEFKGVLKMDQIAYRITITPIKEGA